MRRLLTALGFVTVFATLALAENFSGRLIDATCTPDQLKTQNACQPTGTTTMFAVDIGSKIYKLDNAGNIKAVDALKNRADRSSDPNNLEKAAVVVKITGSKDGDTIKVDTLEVQ